jgi:hypothetical protein
MQHARSGPDAPSKTACRPINGDDRGHLRDPPCARSRGDEHEKRSGRDGRDPKDASQLDPTVCSKSRVTPARTRPRSGRQERARQPTRRRVTGVAPLSRPKPEFEDTTAASDPARVHLRWSNASEPDVQRATHLPHDPKIGWQRSHPQRGLDDTSPGVRYLSAKSAPVIVDTPAYLTDAFRSQGFSPSQRFDPTGASRLCFAPLPPIGFRPSELLPPGQPRCLSAPCALLSFNRRLRRSFGPTLASQPGPSVTPSSTAPTSEP